jgi:DNA-binding CsgD family transcriptional regulator
MPAAVNTVRTYLRAIFAKLGIQSRVPLGLPGHRL